MPALSLAHHPEGSSPKDLLALRKVHGQGLFNLTQQIPNEVPAIHCAQHYASASSIGGPGLVNWAEKRAELLEAVGMEWSRIAAELREAAGTEFGSV